jgi:excisionase family DNA binding protein
MTDFINQIPDAAKNVNDLRPSLNNRETAKIIGCCTKTLAKFCDDGEIGFHMVGNKRMFRPEDIEDFWKRKRIDPSEPPRVDSSHTKDERRKVVRKGSDAGQVTLEEIRSLCRQ